MRNGGTESLVANPWIDKVPSDCYISLFYLHLLLVAAERSTKGGLIGQGCLMNFLPC